MKREYHPLDPRRLQIRYLNLPRTYRGPRGEWEITRGFRTRILSPQALALFLGPPPRTSNLLSKAPEVGEESFLLLPAPLGLPQEALSQALALPTEEGWRPDVVLVLCGSSCPLRVPRAYPSPVLLVVQNMPGELCQGMDFFNLEQSLPQFGRIGRRVARRVRLRRLWPW